MQHHFQHPTEFISRHLQGVDAWVDLTPEFLLSGPERPGLDPTRRGARQSVNQHCELLRSLDGWVAVQLARRVDHEAVPAAAGMLNIDIGAVEPWPADAWGGLRRLVSESRSVDVVDVLRTLGVAAAVVGEAAARGEGIVVSPADTGVRSGPVLDLSALWAGPLAAHLIGLATGCEVVDVESTRRLDPMRLDSGALGDWLHSRRRLEVFDHHSSGGLERLADLVADASVVVTSGRRRALASLGLDPLAAAGAHGCLWVHVSGHGLASPLADAAAFGDDAAAAAGLVHWVDGEPRFIADAVADPLTGVAAARAAVDVLAARPARAALIDVAMVGVAAESASQPLAQ